jgi:hypothetical protein
VILPNDELFCVPLACWNFVLFARLKTSPRSGRHSLSRIGKTRATAQSSATRPGPVSTLRPLLPKVPVAGKVKHDASLPCCAKTLNTGFYRYQKRALSSATPPFSSTPCQSVATAMARHNDLATQFGLFSNTYEKPAFFRGFGEVFLNQKSPLDLAGSPCGSPLVGGGTSFLTMHSFRRLPLAREPPGIV